MCEVQSKQCGCGRSISGFCDGSHALTNQQYEAKIKSQSLNESTTSAQLLTEVPVTTQKVI